MANRERGRRVKARVDSAGLAWAEIDGSGQQARAAAGLSLQGIQCEIFADTGFNPLDHLLPCLGDESNQVDRYDGRLLLDDLPGARTPPRSALVPELEDATEAELDAERYAGLDHSREGELDGASAAWAEEEGRAEYGGGSAADTMAAVPFSYEDAAGAGIAASSAEAEVAALHRLPDEPFRPSFRIPEELASTCPETEREHKIIAQTAKFVREAAQIEFVLRVKQAGNPNFEFLMPQDRLHPYFRWLVAANPEANSLSATAIGSEPQSSALGMLSTYGSDSLGTPTAASKSNTPFQQDSADASSPETHKPLAPARITDSTPVAAQAGREGPAEATVPRSDSLAAGELQPRAEGIVSNAPGDGRVTDAPAAAALQPMPPADVLQIMETLVGFIKKHGAKFEASVRQRERTNPRFAFLQPDQKHHLYYRQLVRDALGSAEAEAILPALPIANPAPAPVSMKLPAPSSKLPHAQPSASASAQEPARAAAPAPSEEASRPVSHGSTVEAAESRPLPPWLRNDAAAAKPSPIRANPSVVRGLLKMHGPEPDPDAAAPAATAAGLEEGVRGSAAGDVDPLEAAEAQAPQPQSAAERAAEEERKAQRRRLARELMLARRQQQLVKEAQERKRRVNDIAQHRSAFTMEEDDYKVSEGPSEQPEPGELHAEPRKAVLPQPAEKPSLPKLEDILRARRQDTALHVHQLITLSPERDELRKRKRRKRSSSSDGSDEARRHGKAKGKRRARSVSASSDSSSNSDSAKDGRRDRRRDSRGREDDGRSRRRGDNKHKSKGAKRSRHRSKSRSDRRKGAKRHRRKESGSDDSDSGAMAAAPADSTALSDDLRAKVRALLG